ncbi:hypothetical protein C8Q76DRAFT_750515 [Earliella scabrosa]|nr:hypothetical protein C8Q76DRAFT_750515 [Earliella scabrosa]
MAALTKTYGNVPLLATPTTPGDHHGATKIAPSAATPTILPPCMNPHPLSGHSETGLSGLLSLLV